MAFCTNQTNHLRNYKLMKSNDIRKDVIAFPN
jgi:hypothetical protein